MLRRLAIVVAALVAVLAPVAHATDDSSTEGVPRLNHIFTVVLENSNYDASWGSGSKLTSLATWRNEGAFIPNYYGTGHASADNYIAMTSGQPPTPVFMGDCENYTSCIAFERALPDQGRNVTDQLNDAGLSWRAYMESMTSPCLHPGPNDVIDPYSSPYATRHNPFVYYPTILDHAPSDPADTRTEAWCKDHVVSYDPTSFQTMLATDDNVPNYVFMTPDTCDDGHDSIAVSPCKKTGQVIDGSTVDAWLKSDVQPIVDYVNAHADSALFITFDENGFSDPDCCDTSGAWGGHIGMLVLGGSVKHNYTSTETNDHYGFLRTVEDALGIDEHLNLAGSPGREPISCIWTTSTC